MKRKSYTLLVLGALAGAAATGFLVVTLLGEDRAGARTTALGESSRRGVDGLDKPTKKTVIADKPKRVTVRPGSGGAVRPGQRQPYDSPATYAERRQWSSRVLKILDEIQAAANSKTKRDLYVELQKLIRKLGQRVPVFVRDALLGMLTTVDPIWRELVGDTLGNLEGDTDTARKLVEMLRGRPENVRTRRAILRALGKMKVTEVVPDLLKMIRAGYESENVIVRALGGIGGREVALGLLGKLDGLLIASTRTTIEAVLGDLKDVVVLEKMEEQLGGADPQTRTSYLNVLGKTRNDRYAKGVRELVKHERDPRGRKAAIRALGLFGDAESGKLLLELVQHGTTQDRVDATRAIYQIRDAKTVGALAENWTRLSDAARIAVIGAGARLPAPGKKLKEIAMDGLRDSNKRVRNFSMQVLGKPGNDAAVDRIVNLTRGASGAELMAGFQALLKIRTKKAAEAGLRNLHLIPNENQRKYFEAQFKKR